MEELETEKKEIFEYLTGVLPLVGNRDELEIHFRQILNVVETSEDTQEMNSQNTIHSDFNV